MLETLIQQYIAPVAQWILGLLTPAEWSALVWLVAGTFMFTHFAKIAWRLLPIAGGGNNNAIHLMAGIIGLLIAWAVWPTSGYAPWWIAGPVAGGGGAIGVFKGFYPVLSFFFPRLAAAFNADRRECDVGPPGGISRRSEDRPNGTA